MRPLRVRPFLFLSAILVACLRGPTTVGCGPEPLDLSPPDSGLEDCDDGIDNDGDRLVDCLDWDCGLRPVCAVDEDAGEPDASGEWGFDADSGLDEPLDASLPDAGALD